MTIAHDGNTKVAFNNQEIGMPIIEIVPVGRVRGEVTRRAAREDKPIVISVGHELQPSDQRAIMGSIEDHKKIHAPDVALEDWTNSDRALFTESFESALKAIDKGMLEGRTTVFHCEFGQARSPTIAFLALCAHLGPKFPNQADEVVALAAREIYERVEEDFIESRPLFFDESVLKHGIEAIPDDNPIKDSLRKLGGLEGLKQLSHPPKHYSGGSRYEA